MRKIIVISVFLTVTIFLGLCKAEEISGKELYKLAQKYENGKGVKKDFSEALELYKESAEKGYVLAQSDLGYFYQYGYGVEKNAELALKWNKKAAEQGNAQSQLNLAVMYDEGIDIPENNEEANKWYMKAADQGHSVAQLNLGVNYCRGEGVEQSYEKAWKLLNHVRMNSPDRNAKWRARGLLDKIKFDLRLGDNFGTHAYPSWEELIK